MCVCACASGGIRDVGCKRDEYYAQYGSTPLILAAFAGHADCVRLFLDAGADKDATNNVRHRVGVCVFFVKRDFGCVG
jgi:hypothetical protein